jgi:hypothetical protein
MIGRARKTRYLFAVGVALSLAWTQHTHDETPAAMDSDGGIAVEDTGSELILTSPPVELPAMDMAEGHEGHGGHMGVYPPVGTITIPMHGYLRGFDYEVVDGNGEVLPRQIVHHFNIIDPDHRELFLPISQRILAAGQETGSQTMPRALFGVPVYAGQRLVFSVMLHNPTGETHHDVSLRVRLKYVKVGRPWPLFEVYPFQLDVAFPAGDKSFDLPPGESSQSWEGQPSMEGRIMVVGCHLHELATHITLDDVTDGKTLWAGYPVTGDDGRSLDAVTIGHVYWRLGIKISPSHVYRVTVFYENPSADTIQSGGMGVVAGVFMPSDGGIWPRVDASDPLYALDREHYMREVRGTYDVIATGGGVIADDHEHDHDAQGSEPEHHHH